MNRDSTRAQSARKPHEYVDEVHATQQSNIERKKPQLYTDRRQLARTHTFVTAVINSTNLIKLRFNKITF